MDTPFKERFLSAVQRIASLVISERNESYGDPREDFQAACDIWRAHRRGNTRVDTPEDLAMFMVCVKLAREGHAHKADNGEDGSSYWLIRNALSEPLKRGE